MFRHFTKWSLALRICIVVWIVKCARHRAIHCLPSTVIANEYAASVDMSCRLQQNAVGSQRKPKTGGTSNRGTRPQLSLCAIMSAKSTPSFFSQHSRLLSSCFRSSLVVYLRGLLGATAVSKETSGWQLTSRCNQRASWPP